MDEAEIVGFEEEGDEIQDDGDIPPESRILRTQAYDKSVGDLINLLSTDEIVFDPDYQRNYIWDNTKASLLVESFLLNVPIPIIYVSEEQDGRWSVVDGLQRLTSLRRFFGDEFKLNKLEVIKELNGLTYSKLPPKSQRVLRNGILRIIVILQESHPEIKYDIFQRLNRGSIKLNEQELRNCLYRGEMTSMLREVRKNQMFLDVSGFREPHRRFFDAELILRCMAMGESFDPQTETVTGYSNKMKSFLNEYMERNKKITKDGASEKAGKFLETVEKVRMVFGAPAFRRYIPETGTHDIRLNRALMDSIMASFWRIDQQTIERHRNAILEISRRLPTDDKRYNDALIFGTSDKRKVDYRVAAFYRQLNLLMGQ